MIKIIKKGWCRKNLPTYEITCKHCHTVFTCNDDDLRDVMVGHGEYYDAVVCPFCHNELVLKFATDCDMKVIYAIRE